ncbi:MAG TPA: SRPBCC family protein [Thermoplasmata archaeon]|nr:SRPBCC family protein [Thermoplasmata archaeon]
MSASLALRAGRVSYERGSATLTFERLLGHPIEDVWDAITGSDHLQRWYMTKAIIEGRKDGRIEFWSGGAEVHVTGRILTWDPPRVFEHERNIEPRKGIPTGERSVIRWELTPEAEGTRLRLIHTRLPPELAVQIAPATHALLDRLEDELDHAPLADFPRRIAEVKSLYRPRRR